MCHLFYLCFLADMQSLEKRMAVAEKEGSSRIFISDVTDRGTGKMPEKAFQWQEHPSLHS